MDIISFNEAATANGRIEKFIENPDSNSGIVTVPKVIGAGESVTIPAGRMAVLPNVQVDGTLNIEGEVFIPTGATFGDLEKGLLPIGVILNAYTIFDNCIVAFGGEFNRADYPKLWAYLQANSSLVKTQAQWQTEATANGGICGFFSDGNGTTTFRVPNLDKAFLRPDSRGVGTYQADDFKTHTHSSFNACAVATGGSWTVHALNGNLSGSSLTTSGGTETRPKNIAVLPLIVAK